MCCWVIAEYGYAGNKDKPVVEPPNYAVHGEGEMLGGVITIRSPRCLYSEVFNGGGWGRVGGCGDVGVGVVCFTFGKLYTVRLSGGVPGFFVRLLF
jgi:hypothetical protein